MFTYKQLAFAMLSACLGMIYIVYWITAGFALMFDVTAAPFVELSVRTIFVCIGIGYLGIRLKWNLVFTCLQCVCIGATTLPLTVLASYSKWGDQVWRPDYYVFETVVGTGLPLCIVLFCDVLYEFVRGLSAGYRGVAE